MAAIPRTKDPVILTDRDRAILVFRLLADKPMTRVRLGELFGVCPARVAQIEARLCRKLRRGLAERWGVAECDVDHPAVGQDGS